MPIKTVLLHIGMHKTGTTSIQFSLSEPQNKLLLREAGFAFFSEFGKYQSRQIYNMFSQNDPEELVLNILKNKALEEILLENKENFSLLETFISRSQEETLIISCEEFSAFGREELENVRNYFRAFGISDFRIFLYTRQPVDFYTSLTQTYERMGIPLKEKIFPLEEETEELSLFRDILDNFESVFAPEQISVFSFEEALQKYNSPVLHFLHSIGIEESVLPRFEEKRANESLCQKAVDFLIYLNLNIPAIICENGKKTRNPFRDKCEYWRFFSVHGKKFSFSITENQLLAKRLFKDAIWLKHKTGIDYVQSLDSILHENKVPLSASPPETYDELFEAFKYSQHRPFRLLILQYFEALRTRSTLWNTLFLRCFCQEYRFLWQNENALYHAVDYTSLHNACWTFYMDIGDGFHAPMKISKPYSNKNNGTQINYEILLDLSDYPRVNALRFDPADSACLLRIRSAEIWADGHWEEIAANHANDSLHYNKMFFFCDTLDPQIYFPLSVPTKKFRLGFDLYFLSSDIWRLLRSEWRRTEDRLQETNQLLPLLEFRSQRLSRIETSIPYKAVSHMKRFIRK